MDLTLKSKSWAGNIYHQFESICHDVDGFMGKDTARSVENNVQSVGTSVKRLYSDVVRDIIPLSQNIAKPEPQSMDGEQATTVDEKQVSENQGYIGNFRSSDASLASDSSYSSAFVENETLFDVSSKAEEEEKEMCQGFLSSDVLDSDFVEKDEIGELVADIGDLNMVTVDLSPDVKQVETNVILNGNFVHAATHGKRNFRYYKKLIQDTLTSQKRLSKEYEHLAIFYGDIEFETSQHFDSKSAPSSSSNSSVHAVRTESLHETSENEWELV
ncbi:hypothetical protein CASFOL_019905 [Castilleja foliolosa]|uniref:Uncharacterized protein n=1 Tax=Castilleja foliolosa TaxID=1961234 RepID=A0ABD3D051_9LAMI